jgi:hypothetical protein
MKTLSNLYNELRNLFDPSINGKPNIANKSERKGEANAIFSLKLHRRLSSVR